MNTLRCFYLAYRSCSFFLSSIVSLSLSVTYHIYSNCFCFAYRRCFLLCVVCHTHLRLLLVRILLTLPLSLCSVVFLYVGARRDAHGYYWITGRVDDVINVSQRKVVVGARCFWSQATALFGFVSYMRPHLALTVSIPLFLFILARSSDSMVVALFLSLPLPFFRHLLSLHYFPFCLSFPLYFPSL